MADEIDAIFDQAHGLGGEDQGDEIDAIFNAAHGIKGPTRPAPSSARSAFDNLLQFGSGAIEGTADLFGMGAEAQRFVNPMMLPQTLIEEMTGTGSRPAAEIKALENEYLPSPTEDTRYSRRVGQFVGPGGILGGAAKALRALNMVAGPTSALLATQAAPAAIASGISGGVSSQAAEDVTGNKTIAPLLGGIFGSMAPTAFGGMAKHIKSVLAGANPAELTGSAAQALRDVSGMTGNEIGAAARMAPADDLGKMMTTAEVTGNAGIGQLEKTIAGSGDEANQYLTHATARNSLREQILNELSPVAAVNKEGLGTELIQTAGEVSEQMAQNADDLWKKVPRELPINVSEGQQEISRILESQQGGLPPSGPVKTLLNQFLSRADDVAASDAELTSGALQDIRSDALRLLREKPLSNIETRALTALEKTIDKSGEAGFASFGGDDYERWLAARAATAERAQTFGHGTAGGTLTRKTTRPANALSNVLKGDTRSIDELKAAIGNDPDVLEKVQRGVLDMIPRDVQGNLTPDKMKRFINGNEGAIVALYGDDGHAAMSRIFDDLQSQANVRKNAFKASEGNSVTSQKKTVAGVIDDAITGSLTPGMGGGIMSKLIDAVKQGAGIRDAQGVRQLLFKAVMDPDFAADLAATPSRQRILTAMERLQQTGAKSLTNAARATVLEGSRQQQPAQSPADGNQRTHPRALRSTAAAQPLAPASAAGSSGLLNLASPQGAQVAPIPRSSNSQAPASQELLQRSSQNAPNNKSQTDQVWNALLDSIKNVESSGNSNAVSYKDGKIVAQGPYQFTEATAKDYGLDDPFNEPKARAAALKKVKSDFAHFGDMSLAIAAYNSGRKRIDDLLKSVDGDSYADIVDLLPAETRAHVPKVEAVFARLMSS